MKNNISIQIQLIAYNENPSDIIKSIASVQHALKIAGKNGLQISARILLGDASESPIFSEDETNRGFEYFFFGFNSGYGKGHNLLSQKSDSDFALIMNPDILLSPGFFIETIRLLEDESVGIVEARQMPIEHPKEYNTDTLETEWSSGACFVIRHSLFKELGGFDTDSFFMYCEDVDLSWRVRMRGAKILYQPNAPVFHSKHLPANGRWAPTGLEMKYSCLSQLMLAYKWMDDRAFKEYEASYSTNPSDEYKEAVDAFSKRKASGNLPTKIKGASNIATFKNGLFTEHRYIL